MRSAISHLPYATHEWRPWLPALLVMLVTSMCLGLNWAGYRRLDLVDVTFVNGCAARTYQIHWQDKRRYPNPFRYEFTGDSVSFVIAIVWIENGPTLRYFKGLPMNCPGLSVP